MALTKKQRDVVNLVEGWYKKLARTTAATNRLSYSDRTAGWGNKTGTGQFLYTYDTETNFPDAHTYGLRVSINRDWSDKQYKNKQSLKSPKGPMRTFRLAGKYTYLDGSIWRLNNIPNIVLNCSLANCLVSAKTLQDDINKSYEVVGCLLDAANHKKSNQSSALIYAMEGHIVTNNPEISSMIKIGSKTNTYLTFRPRKYHTHLILRLPLKTQKTTRKRTIGVLTAMEKGLEAIIS